MMLAGKVICTCYLGVLSLADIRNRTLPCWLLGVGMILALMYRGIERGDPAVLWIAGAVMGAGFFIISKITREALGYGDSVLIGILGIYLGIRELTGLLLTAFLLTAIYAAFSLMKKRFRRKTAFPFVPFLEVAYVITLAAGG